MIALRSKIPSYIHLTPSNCNLSVIDRDCVIDNIFIYAKKKLTRNQKFGRSNKKSENPATPPPTSKLDQGPEYLLVMRYTLGVKFY